MGHWTLIRSLGFILAAFGTATLAFAADPLSALDLVSHDAALCVEIPNLEKTWANLESSPLMDRLRAFPPSQHFFESDGIKRWRKVEERVAVQTGQNLSEQLRLLFAKSLVLAMYVPTEGEPRGILIGEATNAESIKKAFKTWNSLDQNVVIVRKSYRGGRYLLRKRHPNASDSLFFASSERWFAISDHESLIQDVIERFLAATGEITAPGLSVSLRRSNVFARNRDRLKRNAAAYVYIGARPWDRGLQELPDATKSPISPAAIWKHVSVISASLEFDRGILCDTVIELDKANLPSDWSQFVLTGSGAATWNHRIPAEAILAFGGHLELVPFARLMLNQFLPNNLDELAKSMQTAKNLWNGQDLFESILPSLARNFCGYVATVTDPQTKQITLDGMLGFTLDAPNDDQLLQDVNNGLEPAVKLLAAYFNTGTSDSLIVNREQTDSLRICSTDSASFPIALGTEGQNLVIAGSCERLRRSFDTQTWDKSPTRLTEHSRRYFPNANQLLWFDTAQTRNLLNTNSSEVAKLFAPDSEEDKKRLVSNFEQIIPTLELVDSLFMAGRIEYDHIRITFGGGLDEN